MSLTKIIYILKKNIQQKKGIKLMKGDYQKIRKEAISDNYKVIQTYLNNPYLINQRKVNLRIYLNLLFAIQHQCLKMIF